MDYNLEHRRLEACKKLIISQMDKLRQKYADEKCPLKIGEEVTICGWSHRGKKGIIKRVKGFHAGGRLEWQVSGRVLKKDGTEGNNSFDFYESQYQKHLSKNEQPNRPTAEK